MTGPSASGHRRGNGICRRVWLAAPIALAAVGARALPAPPPLELARDGRTDYAVVQAEGATEPERFAARELTNFLARVTGATFPVVAESAGPAPARGIYVGWTRYAAGQGIDTAALGEEEWVIRTVGENLVLAGGRPRGTLYAVYEFLEKQVGCHWLDADTEVVPSRPVLTLGALDVRGKPRFWMRYLMCPLGTKDSQWLFLVRNKNYRYDFRGRTNFFPEGAFHPLTGSPGIAHTFHRFVNASNWFETHPEYFSLDAAGNRVPAYSARGPGQLCLTHPDVRRLTLEALRGFIAGDRAQASAKGSLPPKVYELKHNDKYDAHCRCTNCQAIAAREGGESGPNIDFLNAIGEAIEADYPDIVLATHAYNLTAAAPKTLRARRNVLVDWCDVYSQSDPLRPLAHPCNAGQYETLRQWGGRASRLGIVDYWPLYSHYPQFPLPWTLVQCLGPDLKFFAACGAERFRADACYYVEPGGNFIALTFWLACQLLVDPDQPAEPLIAAFLDGYYGAAAPAMNAYLAYLTQRMDADAVPMQFRHAPHQLAYLDLAFFETAQRLLGEAQARAAPGGLEAAHVRRERVVVDGALLHLWPWLERKLPRDQALPFDRAAVIARYQDGWRTYAKHWYNIYYTAGPQTLNPDGKRMDRIVSLFRDARLPEPFRSLPAREVADFNWLTFPSFSPRQTFVADADAAGGMAAEPAALSAIQAAEKGAPAADGAAAPAPKTLAIGVTGGPTVTLAPGAIPADGRYHLYAIGRIEVRPGTMVWALEGRKLGVCVDRVWEPDSPAPSANAWDAYISLKVQGPAYVPGSTASNGVWMDRVLLAKPQPGPGRADR